MRFAAVLACGLAATACSSGPSTPPHENGAPSVLPPSDAGGGAGVPDAGSGGAPDGGSPDAGAPDSGTPGPLGGGDWGQYRHDQRGSSENPATFSAAEARTLTDAWSAPVELGQYVYTQAVITTDTIAFTTAFSGKIVTVNASGADPRSRTLNSPISTSCGGSKQPGFWAAPALVGDVLYVASPDGNAYALRKADLSTIWSARIADPTAAGHGEFVQSSPSVSPSLNRLYLGVASSAHCDPVAGRVVAIDLATGAVQQKALVGPGQRGSSVWSSISVAEDEGRIYVTSGNRVGPIGETPYSQSIIAMDARTLDIVDHWQNPTTLENSDFGSSPTLFEAGETKLVAATNKDGYLYVLRRDALSAGPVWKEQIALIDPANPTVGGDPTQGWGSISTPAFAQGRLFAAGGQTPQHEPGAVIAYQPANGDHLWKHPTPGYVIAPLAVAGDILLVESSAVDGTSSTLEILHVATGEVLNSFRRPAATFAAPSIGHGLLLWTDVNGHVTTLAAKNYRR